MNFAGKTALITGGTRGIGRAISLAFAEKKCSSIIIIGRDAKAAEKTLDLLHERGSFGTFYRADLLDESTFKKLSKDILYKFDSLDFLINNAGINEPGGIFSFNSEVWDRVNHVNVKAPLLLTSNFAEHINSGGSVVNISSVLGLTSVPEMLYYCVSKAAIIAATKQMALDFASRGVRVNCIAPGLTDTEMPRKGAAELGDPEKILKEWLKNYPIKRICNPREIAEAVCFLCSQDASFITGSVLPVEGGFLISAEGGLNE